MCVHRPPCPSSDAPDAVAAHVVSSHPEQGWSLLCNGVLLFDDGGELLPDGRSVEPTRALRWREAPTHGSDAVLVGSSPA